MADEPALKHVYMWTPDGWLHVTAHNAPGKYELYTCALCGQVVLLAEGPKRSAHFKHKSADYKYCPERTSGNYSGKPQLYRPKNRFQIRLAIHPDKFSFELEMPRVPEYMLTMYSGRDFVITANKKIFSHCINCLSEKNTTFCYVGDYPSEKYTINAPRGLLPFDIVEGVSPERGGLFSSRTCRYIWPAECVQTGKVYYLLTRKEYPDGLHSGVYIEFLAEHMSLNLYEVMAKNLSKSAAEFFMNHRYRLTEGMSILWPAYVERHNVFRHNRDSTIIHVNGAFRVSLKAIPEPDFDAETYYRGQYPAGRIVELPNTKRLTLKTENTSINIQPEAVTQTHSACAVEIKDGKDTNITSGEHTELPAGGFVSILAPFDGFAVIRRNGVITGRQKISDGNICHVSGVKYGTELEVFQGLDRVFQASFRKKTTVVASGSDDFLLERLCSFSPDTVPTGRRLGGLYERLKEHPKIREWLYRAARKAMTPEQAVKLLRQYISNTGGS